MFTDVQELTPWTSDEIDLLKKGKWLVLKPNVMWLTV